MAFFVYQDSPINKLLYARDIPRYKQMVERCVHLNVATQRWLFGNISHWLSRSVWNVWVSLPGVCLVQQWVKKAAVWNELLCFSGHCVNSSEGFKVDFRSNRKWEGSESCWCWIHAESWRAMLVLMVRFFLQVLRWHQTDSLSQRSGDELRSGRVVQGEHRRWIHKILYKYKKVDYRHTDVSELLRRAQLPGGATWVVQVHQQILRPGEFQSEWAKTPMVHLPQLLVMQNNTCTTIPPTLTWRVVVTSLLCEDFFFSIWNSLIYAAFCTQNIMHI